MELSLSGRFSRADEHYEGSRKDVQRERDGTNVVNRQASFELRANLGLTERWSATLSVPWFSGTWSLPLPPVPSGTRHEQSADGLGDVILGPRVWLLAPATHADGNLQVGLGVKAPTGREDLRHDSPDLQGDDVRARYVDTSIQPGDGGWGLALEMNGFRDAGPVRLFGSATYLANPREQNRTLSTPAELVGPAALPADLRFNSVPDRWFLQAGASTTIGSGLGASLALRAEGVPRFDLWGGDEGFRRPGYSVSAAPGLTWTSGAWTVSLSAPITLYRAGLDDAAGRPTDPTFADASLILGVSVRF